MNPADESQKEKKKQTSLLKNKQGIKNAFVGISAQSLFLLTRKEKQSRPSCWLSSSKSTELLPQQNFKVFY